MVFKDGYKTISLCMKNGKPSMMGEHKFGAIIAQKVQEVQHRFHEERDKVT